MTASGAPRTVLVAADLDHVDPVLHAEPVGYAGAVVAVEYLAVLVLRYGDQDADE